MAKQVAWQGKKGHGTASPGMVRQSRVWGAWQRGPCEVGRRTGIQGNVR